jgi:NAD(P)-dependent dehydrogenase (short-subunit alcohol dehydrogenase family)
MMPSAFEADASPESVLTRARKLGLTVSRLPSLEGSGETPRLAPVAVEDLLLRPSVKIDYGRLEAFVRGKSVVVTGGGGSIGSEICDRALTFGAARLLIVENAEPALHAITESLAAKFPDAVVEGRIADIRDRDRIIHLMTGFKPDIVFHAAALKHVPILERDWGEGVKTNIFGSVNVADAAAASGAEAMVMISTDKAIEPVSMLGLTKRFAEMYCQALDRDLLTRANGKAPTEREPTAKFSRTDAISTTSHFQRRNQFRSWRLWAATSGSSRRTNGPLPKLFRSLSITLPRVSERMARTLIGPPAISRSPCIITTRVGNSIRSFILTRSPRT